MKAAPSSTITTLKRFVLIFALGVLVLGSVSVAPAAAARPCWKNVMADWFADSKVDARYPIHCYKDAIKHVPPTTEAYSNARDAIRNAMLFAIAHPQKPSGPSGPSASDGRGVGLGPGEGGDQGVIPRLLSKLGPKNADAVPLPLLVLAGISLLLLGTAGASYAARKVQARRLEPAPAPAPTEPQP